MDPSILPVPAAPATDCPFRPHDMEDGEDWARYFERVDPPTLKIRGEWQKPKDDDLAAYMAAWDARRAAAASRDSLAESARIAAQEEATVAWKRRDVHLRRALCVVAEVAHLAGRADVAIGPDDEDGLLSMSDDGPLVGAVADIDRALSFAQFGLAHPDHADHDETELHARMAPAPWTPGRVAGASRWIWETSAEGAVEAGVGVADLAAEFAGVPVPEWGASMPRRTTSDKARAAPAAVPAEAKPEHEADPGMIPDHLMRVPGLVGQWWQYAMDSAFRPQPEHALGAALVGSGVLIGSRLCSAANPRVRANLYGIGLGGTSCGKDGPRQAVKDLLMAGGADRHLGPEDLASDSGLVSALLVEPRLLFMIDEIGFLLAACGAADAQPHHRGIAGNLLRLFTSSHTQWKGKAYADADRNPTIDQPHAGMWATGTPDRFWSSLTRESVEDGLLGRTLLFLATPTPPKRRTPSCHTPPEALVESVRAWMVEAPSGLASLHPTAKPVPCDAAARRSIEDEFERLNDLERSPTWAQKPGAALHGRVAELGHKLALIYAWSRNQVVPVIDGEAMAWGLGLARFSAERLAWYAERRLPVSASGHEKELLRTLEVIRQAGAGGIPRAVLIRRTRLPARRLDEVLDALRQGGEVVEGEIGRSTAYRAT